MLAVVMACAMAIGAFAAHALTLDAAEAANETAAAEEAVLTVGNTAKIGDVTYASLQVAIDAVKNGETIKLTADVDETVTVNKEKVSFTIDGAVSDTENVKFTGVIKINIGQTFTIRNVDFVHEGNVSHDFIMNEGSPTGKNYNTTLTVEDCTFTGNKAVDTVAIRSTHPTAVTVRNCEGKGLHSFIQNQGGQAVTFENLTVTDSKSALSVGGVRASTVKNCKLNVGEGYGIRVEAGTANAVHTIESSEISAFIPVVVRKVSAENVVVVLDGTNTLTETNTDGLVVAVGTSEYETNGTMPTAPGKSLTVKLKDSGIDASTVYGAETYEAKLGEEYFATAEAAVDAAKDGDTVVLIKDIAKLPIIDKAITVSGISEDKHITVSEGNGDYPFGTINGTVTFKYIDFANASEALHVEVTNADYSNLTIKFEECNFNEIAGSWSLLIGTSYNNNLVKALDIQNCNFTASETAAYTGNYMVYAQCTGKVTIKNCVFDGKNNYRAPVHLGDSVEYSTVAVVENNTFKNFSRGILIGNRGADKMSSFTISGNTFENIRKAAGETKPEAECAALYVHGNTDPARISKLDVSGNSFNNCAKILGYDDAADINALASKTEAKGNKKDGVLIGDLFGNPAPKLPTATVSEIKDANAPALTFALNFSADNVTEEQLAYYGNWYADFVLTINKTATFNANGGKDGYLAGQYDAWSNSWVQVPFDDVTLEADTPLKIMEYAASLMGQSGLKLTYNDVYSFVKSFDCGVFFEEAFLLANPDFEVSLELRMYNPYDESESYVIGNSYKFVKTPDEIDVTFVKADVDANGDDTLEGEDLYNIVLDGNGYNINRLNSGDFTFALTSENAMAYEIIDIAGDNITVAPVGENRYEFHFDTKTGVANDTAVQITIAQVKFTGYGKYSFAVTAGEEKTTVIHATTYTDNIVDTYIPGGDITKGEGVLDISAKAEGDIAVPTRNLEINISFPNSVETREADYQKMKVTIAGGTVNETIVLGSDAEGFTFSRDLPYNTTYNVTVTGDGYRTARYAVTMTKDKTLNFWNNVKDNDTVVEEGKYSEKKNFLAGDIVADNNINIYDLSAVVSYFATEITDEADYDKYVKYDLNRDGVIDSKDVAYVLVSWGA